jgi:hypothetical protein
MSHATRDFEIHRGDDWSATFQRAINPIRISSSTNASPIVLTVVKPHGYSAADKVRVYSHETNTEANGNQTVASPTTLTLALSGTTGNGAGGYTGYVAECIDGTGGSVAVTFYGTDRTTELAAGMQPTVSWVDQTRCQFKAVLTDTQTLTTITAKQIYYRAKFTDSAGDVVTVCTGIITFER